MELPDLALDEMTTYERKVWTDLDSSPGEKVDKEPGRVAHAKELVSSAAGTVAAKGMDAWAQVPGNGKAEKGIAIAIDGSFRAYLDVLAKTIKSDDIAMRVGESADEPITSLDGIQGVDLRYVHDAMPSLGRKRAAVAGLHGAAAGFVAGGATAAGAATGGMGALPAAGIFASALVADAGAIITSQLQASSLIAAYHGYEPVDGGGNFEVLRLQAFAATAGAAKGAVLKEIRELALALAARRSIAQLNEIALYQSMRQLFGWLTISTAKKSIAKGVPAVGVVLGGGWNYGTTRKAIRTAERYYDVRFLTEKYGTGPPPSAEIEVIEVVPEDDESSGILAMLAELPVEVDGPDRSVPE
jgi:hypothetical protein